MKQRRAIVVGAGVVGTVTAEALWNRGYDVTVIEKNSQPAMATSAGNAGQLCAPFCLPFGSPGFLPGFFKKALAGLGVGASIKDVAGNMPWLMKFMRNCDRQSYRDNSGAMLRLARESVGALHGLMRRHELDFGYRENCGKLYLYGSADALRAPTQLLELRRQMGFDVRVLDRRECSDIEPLLGQSRLDFAGGIYASDSSVGDCALFTRQLARSLSDRGVAFKYDTPARASVYHQGRLRGIRIADGIVEADIVVLTAAMGTRHLLPARLRAAYPIAPLKGYSVTLPLLGPGPKGTITDAQRAVAFSVLGDSLRITGGAYFSSSTAVPPGKVRRLLDVSRHWFPDLVRYDADAASQGWAGLRPVSPSSAPYIGATDVPGLFINTGHGGFGWTCAAGSAQRLLAALEQT